MDYETTTTDMVAEKMEMKVELSIWTYVCRSDELEKREICGFGSTASLGLWLLASESMNTSSIASKHHCLPDQSSALLQLKQEFEEGLPSDPLVYPKMKSWKANTDCCSWDGVTCNTKTGQVVGLNLSSRCLSGTLSPNSSLFGLHHLQKLNLSKNDFSFSTIPSGFSQLVSLQGEFPKNVFLLPKIQAIVLSPNELLTGFLPEFYSGSNFSSSLSVLNMRGNKIQGNLPDTFTKGSSLKTLDFSRNQIHGKIPRSLVNCRMLEVLNLENNNVIDTFPFWLESLPELQILILRANGFYGPIWGHDHTGFGFSKLRVIDLSYNNFSGKIPSEYFKTWNAMLMVHGRDKSQPEYMEDPSAYYKDSITVMNKGVEMEFVKILTIFTSIDLSNNGFHGEIPDSVGTLKDLIVLNLSSNNFIGRIPSSLGNLIELESLDLSRNKLLGEIPQHLTSLTFLAYLNLSDNQLTGPIPQGGQFGTFENSVF
uniref:Leucine-rich repeat-containing N-terminal plant-type domain-containing protein n=1 Tax=Fagus sylvatica TaxID=28930 RepID=A0A2N9GKF5_FAGSY